MQFSITLLGTNSALPSPERFTAAQVLQVQNKLYLIDCGEGTQIRMTQFGVRRSKIHQIFISHLHGDHFYGLMGLLTSFALNGRTAPIDIFSPPGLEEIIRVLVHYQGGNAFSYPIHFHQVDTTVYQLIYEDAALRVFSLPLKHQIPTAGYLFVEKERERNILPDKIAAYQIPVGWIRAIKQGEDFIASDGRVILNAELTRSPAPPRAYAYCSDTRYNETLIPLLKGVDLLYHEATFLHQDLANAKETMHATATEAAQVAAQAEVGTLILGHFSSRYKTTEAFIKEARAIFNATLAGYDGMIYNVPLREN